MENITTRDIIEPEFSNFLRDTGITLNTGKASTKNKALRDYGFSLTNSGILNELFYEEYKETIWHHKEKLYMISLSGEYNCSQSIKLNEITPKWLLQQNNQSDYWRFKYSFIFLFVGFFVIRSAGIRDFEDTFFITQSVQNNAYTILLVMSAGLFIFADQIRNLIYRIRFYIKK